MKELKSTIVLNLLTWLLPVYMILKRHEVPDNNVILLSGATLIIVELCYMQWSYFKYEELKIIWEDLSGEAVPEPITSEMMIPLMIQSLLTSVANWMVYYLLIFRFPEVHRITMTITIVVTGLLFLIIWNKYDREVDSLDRALCDEEWF